MMSTARTCPVSKLEVRIYKLHYPSILEVLWYILPKYSYIYFYIIRAKIYAGCSSHKEKISLLTSSSKFVWKYSLFI